MKHLTPWFEQLLKPLSPKPTGLQPTEVDWDRFRCIAFDVYGTLLISASGDIGLSSEENRVSAMARTFDLLELQTSQSSEYWAERYKEIIHMHQEEVRTHGVEFPEVEIREVWLELLRGGINEGSIRMPAADLAVTFVEQVAVVFECLSNPVWPMPGALSRLRQLKAEKKTLAIVSNAQFYTPLLLQFFLGETLAEAGFTEDLCFYSYAQREGKPGITLYRSLAQSLQIRAILPEHCLYVGNDQRNDIRPAHATGFATALFAGDQRSLRLRADDPTCSAIRPNYIITTW